MFVSSTTTIYAWLLGLATFNLQSSTGCPIPDQRYYSKSTMWWAVGRRFPSAGSWLAGFCLGDKTFGNKITHNELIFRCTEDNIWNPPLDYCTECSKYGKYSRFEANKFAYAVSGEKCFFTLDYSTTAPENVYECRKREGDLAIMRTYADSKAVREKIIQKNRTPATYKDSKYWINGLYENYTLLIKKVKTVKENCGIGCYNTAYGDLKMIDSLEAWNPLSCYNSAEGCYYQFPGCSEYIGSKHRTVLAFSCQSWSSQYPHRHSVEPYDNLNFCRRYNSKLPWCYTSSVALRWAYCFRKCYKPPGCVNKIANCYYHFPNCTEYAGDKNTTLRGYTCQTWNKQSPHKHSYDPGNNKNYCRRYTSARPWCYTTNKNVRWDWCFEACPKPPDCFDSENNCYRTSSCLDYTGKKSTTLSNRTCQAWTAQTPQTHTTELTGDSNYCRRYGSHRIPWCYTTDPEKRWEYCFQECPFLPRDGPASLIVEKLPQNCLMLQGTAKGTLAVSNTVNCSSKASAICETKLYRRV